MLLAITTPLWAGDLSIAEAIDPHSVESARLSPDGKHIAVIGYTGLNHGLFLIDTETHAGKLIINGQRVQEGNWIFDKEPRSVIWVTNDLLAVDYGIEAESVDLNGTKVADLGTQVIRKANAEKVDAPLLLSFTDDDESAVALYNARTGERSKYHYPMSGKPLHWVFDKDGALRALTLMNSEFWKDVTRISNWYKPAGASEWVKLAEFAIDENRWVPMFVPDQDNTLIIGSSIGRDTTAIFRYDTKKREIGDMLAGAAGQDIVDVNAVSQSEFKYLTTSGMLPQQFWFDAQWAQLQASVDQVLPHRINILSGDPKKQVLIYSYGDVEPGEWLLLDTAKMTLRDVVRSRPSIDPLKMRPMASISYPAKDGLIIPAYLTRPNDVSRPAPTVIMVHGGPQVRDQWGWDADVQLLAAHGYVVLQPQFRGSSGFGRKFLEAGYGQWGLAMQDDITAGVEYLIQAGIADPARICIYGASYGGFAALSGLVKTPQLYRCGVSFAGVSDIAYMFADSSDRVHDKVMRQYMRSHIGDPERNKEQFEQVSPLLHADRIEVPVLLMHGDADQRVPISHMEKMKRALERNHKYVESLTFEDEGHGLQYIKNQQKFYETLFAFLDKYLMPAAPVPPPK